MGSFERFKTKTHFNSLKRLVGMTALAALAVKLLVVALATAAEGGTPLDLLARVPASLADLGAALLVFEVLRSRRPLQLAARSAILVAVSPVLFVASGIHGDPVGVAVALLLLAMYLLVDRDAPLVAGITLALASRVEPMTLLAAPVVMAAATAPAGGGPEPDPAAGRSKLLHFGGALAGGLLAAWVPTIAWRWDSLPARPGGVPGPGGLGPGWVLARSLDQGWPGGCSARGGRWSWPWPCCRPWSGCAAGRDGSTPPSAWSCSPPWPWGRRGRRGTWSGRPCSATWAMPGGPASTPSPPGPPWRGPRPGGGPACPGTAASAPASSPTAPWPASAWSPGPSWARGCSWAGGRSRSRRRPVPGRRTGPEAPRRRRHPRGLWTAERTSPRGRLRSPPRGVEIGGGRFRAPANGSAGGTGSEPGNGQEPGERLEPGTGRVPGDGLEPGDGLVPEGPGTSPSRRSVGLPK